MKQIEITISPTGETTLRTLGFAGSECQHATRFLEKALGATLSEQKTADFYQTATVPTAIQDGAP